MDTEHKGQSAGNGCLYVVATPIGNLADLSERAKTTLATVDLIAAEDTRHSQRLLTHLGIRATLKAIHEHSSEADYAAIGRSLAAGQQIALICDAGTPLISDPGFELVRLAREQGYKVVPIPGACAAVAALSVAGLPSDQFEFRGFPPAKSKARDAFFAKLARRPHTQIFYESSHRLGPSVAAMAAQFGGDRMAFLARELTKLHEQTVRAPLAQLLGMLNGGRIKIKGELVIIVAGWQLADDEGEQHRQAERLLSELVTELPLSRAAKVAAKLTDLDKRSCYRIAERLQQ